MNMRLGVWFVLFGLTLVMTPVTLGQFANADLTGTVVSDKGNPLSGVTISAQNQATGQGRVVLSAGNGCFCH